MKMIQVSDTAWIRASSILAITIHDNQPQPSNKNFLPINIPGQKFDPYIKILVTSECKGQPDHIDRHIVYYQSMEDCLKAVHKILDQLKS